MNAWDGERHCSCQGIWQYHWEKYFITWGKPANISNISLFLPSSLEPHSVTALGGNTPLMLIGSFTQNQGHDQTAIKHHSYVTPFCWTPLGTLARRAGERMQTRQKASLRWHRGPFSRARARAQAGWLPVSPSVCCRVLLSTSKYPPFSFFFFF